MAIFYANVNNIRDDNTWRILLVFANKAVADEWWHAISTGSNPLLSNNVRQISSELYTHDPSQCNIFHFFTDSRFKNVADQFRGRLFLSLENDRGGRGISTFTDQRDPACESESYPSPWAPDLEPIIPEPEKKPSLSLSPAVPSPASQEPGGIIKDGPTRPSTSLPPFAPSHGSSMPGGIIQGGPTQPSTLLPPVAPPRQMLAAIIMPDGPNAPDIYSKYIVTAKYETPEGQNLTVALLVNSDIAVPRFKSKGATNDVTSESSLRVEFQNPKDLTGSAKFGGAIGRGWIQFVTNKQVNIYGPIEGGPEESQSFVGMGSWIMS